MTTAMATALPSPEFKVFSKLLLTAEAEVLQVLVQTQLQGRVAVGVGGWVSLPAGKNRRAVCNFRQKK